LGQLAVQGADIARYDAAGRSPTIRVSVVKPGYDSLNKLGSI
jgi:hypothetical protein